QEIRRNTIGALIVERWIAARPKIGGVRAVGLRLVKEPADIIGDALDQPAGGGLEIGVAAAPAAIPLNDVDLLVEQRADGLAVEFAFEPARVGRDAGPPGGGDTAAGADADAELTGSGVALAGEHGDQLGIPLREHGRQLGLGPLLE